MLKFVLLVAISSVAIATPLDLSFLRATNGRIIGGEDTKIENVPYQVSLLKYSSLTCGGSIIAKHWILTAAHCSGSSASSYTVRAGSNKYHSGGSVHHVSEIIRHEKYGVTNDGLPKNDIALMHVEEPFEFDQTRQPIVLFNQSEEAASGSMGVITGWGRTESGLARTLQLVKVPIVSKEECDKNYEMLNGVPDNQICAGFPEGGKDTCQGDSGGPLAIDGRLAGVTSWGLGCAEAGSPGVYTEVAAYHEWIQHNIQE